MYNGQYCIYNLQWDNNKCTYTIIMYLYLQIEVWYTDVFLFQHTGGLFYSSHTEIDEEMLHGCTWYHIVYTICYKKKKDVVT